MDVFDIQEARINTAGAYVCIDGLYPFVMGWRPNQGRIPVIRMGGHREEGESGWECAKREVYEEASLNIRPLTPRRTYLVDWDQGDSELKEMRWEHATDQEPIPLLVVTYRREGRTSLSLMYLAQADELPAPASEVKGLLLPDKENLHRLCQEALTLEQYLSSGGKAILNGEFDHKLILEPFLQLRLLSKILIAGL
jgi:ADP-ribose pyrophosphatase YjhB (NUDIX family)